MSNFDWSKRHDSTHVDPNTHCFYKQVGGKWMLHLSGERFTSSSSLYNGEADERDLIERPQPKPWSGPEDGLPPVGSIVIARRSDTNKWHESEVLRHNTQYQRNGVCAFMEVKSNMMFWSNEYKAIKTPEQLAAEKRETAIREIMDVADVDCRVTAARLVDAGFKREMV